MCLTKRGMDTAGIEQRREELPLDADPTCATLNEAQTHWRRN